MRCERAGVGLLMALVLGLLAGCGGGPATPSMAPPPTPANLAGNWLLAGSLPEFLLGPAASTELSVTFSTVGDQIVGLGRAFVSCASPNGLFGQIYESYSFTGTGTIAANGTFSVTSPSLASNGVVVSSVQISGAVPTAAGGSWSGTYVLSPSGSCPQQLMGAFSATAIAPVTGVYTGSGTVIQGAVQTPFTATMTLTQGSTSTVAGTPVEDASVLTGGISISGLSCFHAGMLNPVPTTTTGGQRSVQGGALSPIFTMDDGSTLIASVEIHDASAMQLDARNLLVIKGNCDSRSSQLLVGNFVRQQ